MEGRTWVSYSDRYVQEPFLVPSGSSSRWAFRRLVCVGWAQSDYSLKEHPPPSL